jgi:hypothetical protein
MRRRFGRFLDVLSGILFLPSLTLIFTYCIFIENASAVGSFRLVTNGPADEYISAGQPKLFVSPALEQFPDVFDRSLPSGTDYFRLFATYGFSEFFFIDIATDGLGQNLAPGTYARAERASFASPGHPGLDLVMQGRGCNQVTGSFQIHSVSVTADQSVDSIDVSFTQLCEGQEPALVGRFTYNAAGLPIQARAPYESDPPQAVPTLGFSQLLLLMSLIFAAPFVVRNSHRA